MNGMILINAYSENEDYLYQARRLREEFEQKGCFTPIARNACGTVVLQESGEVVLPTLQQKPDFCIFLDKDKYTAKAMEKSGIRLFNPAESIFTCDDKMLTHVALCGQGVVMPKSVPAPFCYVPDAAVGEEYLNVLEKELSYPIVVKHSYGSLGREVFLATDRAELKDLANKLRFTPHFYQQRVGEKGKDLRVIVIGGAFVAGMVRSSEDGDFRSNMALGGRATPFEKTAEIQSLSKKIADVLQLDYCGIDFLFDEKGYYVCEVNSNAFFKGMEKTTGVNVAKAYAEYVLSVFKR